MCGGGEELCAVGSGGEQDLASSVCGNRVSADNLRKPVPEGSFSYCSSQITLTLHTADITYYPTKSYVMSSS